MKKSGVIKFSAVVLSSALFVLLAHSALAAPTPEVSLTFDDAALSEYENAFTVLNAAGQVATLYVPTGLVGTDGYMTWENIVEMTLAGWEMGGHSSTHSELPLLTPEEIQQEIESSFTELDRRGLLPSSFATPYGAYDPAIIAQIASYFESHRGYHDIGFNSWPYNEYLLYVQQVNNQTTLAEVEAWIDEAVANNYWLIIVFHEILPTVEPEDTYSWTISDLQALMSSLDARSINLKTVAQVLNMKDSLFPNSDFGNGIADGWATDNVGQVTADSSSRGAVPSPAFSVKMTGGALAGRLSSPNAPVSFNNEYGARIFANTTELSTGTLDFYIDEYASSGEWISWKYLGSAGLNFVIDESYPYQPTSADVVSAGLRVSLSAGSVGQAFVDNAMLFEIGEGDPLPVPDPVANPDLPPPLPYPNTDFDLGISEGWTTDNPTQVVADASGEGVAPTASSSIKMTGSTVSAHLFSPQALVSPTSSYDLSVFADTTSLTSGELGFYIDEFDADGNWISGKWIGQSPLGSESTLTLPYTPTSASVVSAALQSYILAGSDGDAYVDNFELEPVAPPGTLPLPNTDFSSGISEGWVTNRPTQVQTDSSGRGEFPTSDSSIHFIADGSPSHLFSPRFIVSPDMAYTVGGFIDTTELASGEIGFYVDEFDEGGNWISGKWIGKAPLGQSGYVYSGYTPNVGTVTASLQVYLVNADMGNVYLDNATVTEVSPPPPATALPYPNTDFDLGISEGWTTDNPTQVVADASGEGIAPTASSSIKMTGSTVSAHLFSPQALVSSTSSYDLSVFTDTTNLTSGELGFYIDEFDVDGNWISGKWIGQSPLGSESTLTFPYTPTSASVVSAALQSYILAGSEGDAYLDNFELVTP